MELNEIRNLINGVDDEIAKLYVKRMELGREVALYKRGHNIPLENTQREKEILNRVSALMPDEIKLYGKQVFNMLFDTSKAYQSRIADIKSKVRDDIEAALNRGTEPFPIEASVACQGVAGAYSGIAAEKMFELSAISYFKDWDSVFSAVEKGFCTYGVLPIENSAVGSVNGVYDLMRKHNFYIVRSIKLRVQHYLLARAGVSVDKIKEIVSHEQAISQCSAFLKSLGDVKITVCDNTAQAAKTVAESGREDIACLSARECAGIYGLSVLKSSVQDREGNYTRFIAISKNLEIFEGADKISITVNLPHEAGSLNKILNRFSTTGLNLTKLESRPMPNSPFEFAFYFDFEADATKLEVRNLLAELNNSCDDFLFLGAYKELG
jgi:chorismate mutase/prephenate dehydratase